MTPDAPLLATKLHAPARRGSGVSRSRLTARLDAPGRLVLVAAPAGFGKTSILTEWLATTSARTAWLSLDGRDDDAAQFWRYLLAAVDTAKAGLAANASALLAAGAASTEAVLATLVNDLHRDGDELALVLDDLHEIDDPAIHEGIAFLIENLPANARIVIASRTDPPLPLARMRARGELVELRAADLRFTPDEIAGYLNDVMGLDVDPDDLARLGDRTEGWIAALQLAALSLQGRPDPSAFIAGFAGDDRYVVDYLVEEVLQRQPDATRAFLLQTSVLARLSSDLCDAVTRSAGSAATLEALDRANLFLIPLDDHRQWYRYHHLFAEMLRTRLLDEQPSEVPGLHRRASEWYERRGFTADAIGHAIDAGAFERAAQLIKSASPMMQQQRQEVTLAGWYAMLPPDLVRADPELGIGYAGVLLSSGRTDGVEQLLRDAEAAAGGPSEGVLALRRGIALYGSARAMGRGDLEAALEQSAIAVALSADGSHLDRGSSHGIRGLVLWALGRLEEARATWAVSLDALERAGHLSDVLGGSIAMGDILIALGRLDGADATYRRALDLGLSTEPPLRGTADMHVALADLLRERGDLAGARAHLADAEALGEYAGLPQNRHRRRMAEARLRQAEGDPASGLALLDEAERLYTPDFFPEVRPVAALRIRQQLAAGQVEDARRGIRRRGIGPDDALTYLSEYDHITLARALLAAGAPARDAATAAALLDRLLTAAEAGGRAGAVVELLVLRARGAARVGEADTALDALGRAITLAEREGYVRVFADEGAELVALLDALIDRDGDSAYLRRLRAATDVPSGAPVAAALLDPLSDRELEVMRLLASDLSGPEISRHLVVSLNTLRTHTKNIYVKLGASSRREAVTRARELGLLNSSG